MTLALIRPTCVLNFRLAPSAQSPHSAPACGPSLPSWVLRSRTYKSGTISLGDASVDCLVRNLSATGACLEIKGTASVPEDFKLVIKPENLFRTCKVVWRQRHQVGVLFS
jgi:hypothetical protein